MTTVAESKYKQWDVVKDRHNRIVRIKSNVKTSSWRGNYYSCSFGGYGDGRSEIKEEDVVEVIGHLEHFNHTKHFPPRPGDYVYVSGNTLGEVVRVANHLVRYKTISRYGASREDEAPFGLIKRVIRMCNIEHSFEL